MTWDTDPESDFEWSEYLPGVKVDIGGPVCSRLRRDNGEIDDAYCSSTKYFFICQLIVWGVLKILYMDNSAKYKLIGL